MLRKCTDEDISDEECEKVIDPFYDNYNSYLEEYVVPEVIAFYIASSFPEFPEFDSFKLKIFTKH